MGIRKIKEIGTILAITGVILTTPMLTNAEEMGIGENTTSVAIPPSSDIGTIEIDGTLRLDLTDFKITEKTTSMVKGSFSVRNIGDISASGLNYTIEIYRDNNLADAVLIDTKSYPFAISANQTKTQEFIYQFSDKIIGGIYHAIVKIIPKDGVPIAITLGDIGEIKRAEGTITQTTSLTLKEDLVRIIKNNQELSLSSIQSFAISEEPKGVMTFVNNTDQTIKCYSKITTFSLDNDNAPISELKGEFETFKPGETKKITVDLPAQKVAGLYSSSIIMLNEKDIIVSKICEFKYIAVDNGVKITSIDLDKNNQDSSLNIKVNIVGPSDKTIIKQATVIMKVYDKNQKVLKSQQQITDVASTSKTLNFKIDLQVLASATKVEVAVQKDNKVLVKSQTAISGINTEDKKVIIDVENTKFKEAVNGLVDLGIINGYENGTFKPYQSITRAEFAKIVCIEAKLAEDTTKGQTIKFKDVGKAHWADKYITIAAQHNLIKGYPGGTFKPDSKVNYAEAVTILVRLTSNKILDGTWPDNYIKEGNDTGLTANVFIKKYLDKAIRGDVAIMTWNAYQIGKK